MKTKRIIFYILFSIILFSCENKKVEIKKLSPNEYKTTIKKGKQKKMIHFWASYCQPCIEEFPELIEYCNNEKILLINISSDKSDSTMQENMEKIMLRLKIKNSYIINFNSLYPNGTKNVNLLEDFCKKAGIKNWGNPYYILVDEKGNTIKESSELKNIKN